MPQDDQLDTIIQDIIGGYGLQATPARPTHQLLWFALGLGLFLVDAILAYAFLWFLRHG